MKQGRLGIAKREYRHINTDNQAVKVSSNECASENRDATVCLFCGQNIN